MTYQFRIQLKGIEQPTVWRQLLVTPNITLDIFHRIIQVAFGWQNCHLYQFSDKGWGSKFIYKIPDEEDDEVVEDSSVVKLADIFTEAKQTLVYMYDFGDNWEHQITLEEISDELLIGPICLGGEGACPPEDCGGIPGYMHLKEVLGDPKNPGNKDMRQWLGLRKGQQLDVNAFNVPDVNQKLRSTEL